MKRRSFLKRWGGRGLAAIGLGASAAITAKAATQVAPQAEKEAPLFVQEGAGAVPRSVLSKQREHISLADFDDGAADKSRALGAAINSVKSQLSIALRGTELRYGGKLLELEPGIYNYSETLEFDGDLKIVAKGPPGSVILKYTGNDIAAIVNSRSDKLAGAAENTRSFSMENICILAEGAREGIHFGARAQTGLTLSGVEIFGVNGPPIHCGEAVYFLALHNCKLRNCSQPTFVGAYCDLFTVDDRTLFSDNEAGSLLLECPSFFISNNDFELNGGLADIVIRNTAGMASNRNGIIFKNRFGPEVRPSKKPVMHDIAIVEQKGLIWGSALTDLQLWGNDHFSGGRFPRKESPILVDARIRRFDIRGERFGAFNRDERITSSDADIVHSIGTVWDSFTDDIKIQDDIRGVFVRQSAEIRRPIAAEAIPPFVAVKAVGFKTTSAGSGVSVSALHASDGADYEQYFGYLTYEARADRPIEIAAPGTVVTTDMDASDAKYYAPVYLQRNGSVGLSAPDGCRPFVVGRVITREHGAKILLSPAV
jgi:hypothetical protein